MFEFLREAANPELLRLTSTQKAVLLSIFVAQTPELAADAAIGNEYTVSATEFLAKNNLIGTKDNGIGITSAGFDVLVANGLVDESGEVTEAGRELLAAFEEEKKAVEESLIPFKTLKGIFKLNN